MVTVPPTAHPITSNSTKAANSKHQTKTPVRLESRLTTNVLVDILPAAFTADLAAPVEPTAAFLDDQFPTCRVTSPAAHYVAPVGAVSGAVAPTPSCARRPRPLVGVAEVRRGLDVNELRRPGTTASGDPRLHLSPVKQQIPRRALEPSPPRSAFTYQRHLSYAQTDTGITNEYIFNQSISKFYLEWPK